MKKIILLIVLFISSFNHAQNEQRSEYFLAENYFREGEYEKATQIYKKLYSKSNFNTNYLNRLITCYQETDQFLVAENLLKRRIKSSPKHAYLYVLLGYNFDRQQKKEVAKTYYEKALTEIDKNSNYAAVIANLFKNYTLLDEAILAYQKAMKKNKNANYSFQIAQIYGEKGAFEKMFQSYINMIDKNPNYLNIVQRYASKYITDDAENENNILFRKTLLRKSASNPKNEWNILLSWLFAQQKDYGKAFVQEKALFERNPADNSQLFRLGKIAFDSQDFQAANKIYNFLNDNTFIREEKIEANLYLAKIAVGSKNPEAETIFENLFKKYGKNELTIKPQVTYADFLTFQKNEPQQAIEILEKALEFSRSKFDKARIKLKLGDVLVFTEKYNKALIYFSQIQTQLKNHSLAQEARYKVAQTSYFKGDFTWAKAQLKVLKSSTTQLIANDAVNLFLKITDNEPVDSIPSGLMQFAKAELLSYQNKNQEAITILKEIITDFKGQPVEDEALFMQAKLFVKKGEYQSAIANFEKVITLNSEGILMDDANYQLAELYNYQLNNPKKAQEYYQKIIFDFASSIYLVAARKKYRKLRGDNI